MKNLFPIKTVAEAKYLNGDKWESIMYEIDGGLINTNRILCIDPKVKIINKDELDKLKDKATIEYKILFYRVYFSKDVYMDISENEYHRLIKHINEYDSNKLINE